jgi:hypothetical protein
MSQDSDIEQLARHALAAYEDLTDLAQDVEDEWTYVTDLASAWTIRIEDLVATRGSEAVTPSQQAAVGVAIDEIGKIRDPHRAIDWLSTFPQVVLVALGERP